MSGSILDADMATLARQLREGWRWWLSELAAMVPSGWRDRRSPLLQGWIVRLDQEPPVVTREGRPATPVADAPAAALLPRSACLFRTITLPALSDGDTRRLLDLQIGRLMPFPPGAGLADFGFGPVREGMREVTVAALPIEAAIAAEAAIREAGFAPAAILVQDADDIPRHDFLPALRRARGEPETAAPRRVWWRLVAALLLLNLLLFVATDMLALRNLQRLVEAHGSQAEGVRRARRRILDEEQGRQALLFTRAARDPLAVLADLSRRLPEGARVDRLTIGEDGIRIAGVRRGEADVLGALRAGGRYPDVHSATPDALAQTPEGQPFDIAFDWPSRPPLRTLASRERRLAAIGLLVAAIAIVWLAIVQPTIYGFVDRAERRRDLLQTYARDERLLAQLPSIGRAAAAQRSQAPLFHIAAADAPAASAVLNDRLSRAAAEAGAQVRAIEELAASPGKVRARAQLQASLPEAVQFVDRVRGGVPFVTLDGFAIVANSDAEQPRSGQLDISLEVSASYSPAAPR